MSLHPTPARLCVEGAPRMLLLQLCGTEELPSLDRELDILRTLAGARGFAFAAAAVSDWNRDLSPWPAPPAFGGAAFEGRARETLDALLGGVLPRIHRSLEAEGVSGPLPVCVGGYSLAGLFALWAFYECGAFAGAAAASPSVWFPGWDAFADGRRPPRGGVAYLSLGRREPKTRNRQMATIGDAIERQRARFEAQGAPYVLEWNEGGHFAEPERRTAKGFAWVFNHYDSQGE